MGSNGIVLGLFWDFIEMICEMILYSGAMEVLNVARDGIAVAIFCENLGSLLNLATFLNLCIWDVGSKPEGLMWIKSYCETLLDCATNIAKLFGRIAQLFRCIAKLFGRIAQLFLRNWDYATSIWEVGLRTLKMDLGWGGV